MARYETAETILNDVAVEVGLATSADPYASTDPNFILLRTLLKRVGRELVMAREWKHLHREFSITVGEGDTGVYDLPADWLGMVDQTGWDRTNDRQLEGPETAQTWQYLQNEATGPVHVTFRLAQDQVWLHPLPAAGTVVAAEYRTRYWVQPDGQTEPTADAPTAKTDTICFSPELVTRALKLHFKMARGFDTTAEVADYNRVFAYVAGLDPAPVLGLSGSRGERMISHRNVPDGSWNV